MEELRYHCTIDACVVELGFTIDIEKIIFYTLR
jgi:hypothetical protein